MRVIITQLDIPPPVPAAVAAGIVAQPGGITGAKALSARINIVSVVAAGTGVKLTLLGGQRQEVFNRSGFSLTVYPAGGTAIEGNGVNVPVTIANSGAATFTFDGVQTWLVS